MRFMILGTGMQGRAAAFDMLRNPKTEEILLADNLAENLATAIVEAKAHMQYGKLQRQLERADVVVVDELPRTQSLKVSLQDVAALYSRGTGD